MEVFDALRQMVVWSTSVQYVKRRCHRQRYSGFGRGIVTGTGPSDPDIVRSATNGVHHNAGFDLNMERQYAEGPYMNAPVEARVSY